MNGSRKLGVDLRVDPNSEEGYGQGPKHSETKPGKRIPTHVKGSENDRNRPDEGHHLKRIEHPLTVHICSFAELGDFAKFR